jgi:hypothetical protein
LSCIGGLQLIMCGKAGFLPDATSTFAYWRKQKDDALAINDWDKMSLALRHMNGALPIEYRIIVNDELWNQQKDHYIVWKCSNCTTTEHKTINEGEENEYVKEIEVPTTSNLKDIVLFTEHCLGVLTLLTESKTREMWICPSCKNIASVGSKETQLKRHEMPHYRDCIYSEPSKPLTGLMRRRGAYPLLMRKWGENFSIELERKLVLYRIEYAPMESMESMDSGYKDTGDKQ